MGEIQVLKPRLPDTYQEVEYIETSGTQYIDTGKHYGNGISVYCKFAVTAVSTYGYVFGEQKPNANFALRLINNTYELQILHGDQIVSTGITVIPNAVNECTVAGTAADPEWTINGNPVSVATATFGTTPANTFLCAGTKNETDPVYLGKNRIYEYRVSFNGTTIQQLIPCYRKSDNAIGFYDLATGENDKKFYTNDGTGDFAKGADKSVSGTWINFPSHQKTSTGWKDIPTHTMTANGWQGELTSQSPLKFRATGQSLLDWRIDGASGGVGDWDEMAQRYKIPVRVEGENLFDINGEHTSVVWDGKECLVIENDAIIVNQIRPGYMTGIYYDEVYKPGTYTFAMKQLAAQSDKTAISVVSSAPFAGGVYNDAYKAYTAALVKHDDMHYITIVVTEPTEIGFFINGYFSVNDKIYDIQLLEGTYTASTIPPYEVNIYTDHQLMEDDSIDYATDQTAIPLATGNNVLTVDTAVQPSKVFVKFEG